MRHLLATLLVLVPSVAAQSYRMETATQPGGTLDSLVLGKPGQPFVTLLDNSGGPRTVLGETFFLGLTPALTVIDAGALNAVGARSLRIPIPATVSPGLTLYGQVVLLDSGASNGVFRATNGESAGIYRARSVIVERFDDPVATGLTGNWDKSITGRLVAAKPKTRTVNPVDRNQGWRFAQPILGALNKHGVRIQHVYRARDLQATGDEEVLTAVRWRPFGGKVTADQFAQVVLDVGHSLVVPDYRVDRVSALPRFPNSGLKRPFQLNFDGLPLRVYNGAYAIRPSDLRQDGYIPYPLPQQHFTYNGFDSLLLDFKVPPSPSTNGTNGHQIFLMVASSPRPDGRNLTAGTASVPINPFNATIAKTGDNSMHDLQFEFTRVRSDAISPWIDAGSASPDYRTPLVATSVPARTSVEVSYRGARDRIGNFASNWSTSIDIADTYPFFQYRIVLRGSLDGAVPSVDSLVIPIN